MNKTKFIDELVKETKLSKEDCIKINDVLEENFIIGKNNKEKIVASIMKNLDIEKNKSEEIYNTVSSIISREIKNKIIHPFRKND